MKKILTLHLFLTIPLFIFCQQDSINDNYLNVAVLKLGYHIHTLKCASLNYYNLCPNCAADTLPFDIVHSGLGDFDTTTFRIQNNNDTVFEGVTVWFGTGCLFYPITDCFDTTCFLSPPFNYISNHVQKPSHIDYFSWQGNKVITDSTFIHRADSAWSCRLCMVCN